MDCQGAQEVLRKLLNGASVDDEALQEAQSHLESCPHCAARHVGKPRRWSLSNRKRPVRRRRTAIPPAELIERVLIEALSDHESEPIVRARAAEELALLAEPSGAVLGALARSLVGDPDARVREAARATFERLTPDAPEQQRPSAAREQSA